MRPNRKVLPVFLLPALLFACSRAPLELGQTVVAPVVDSDSATLHLAVWAALGEGSGEMQYTVTSPKGDVWTGRAAREEASGLVWYGTSDLVLLEPESGSYQVELLREDGSSVSFNQDVDPAASHAAMPAFSKQGGNLSWTGGQSLSWTFSDGAGRIVEEGDGKGPVKIPSAASTVRFSLFDEKSGVVVRKLVTLR